MSARRRELIQKQSEKEMSMIEKVKNTQKEETKAIAELREVVLNKKPAPKERLKLKQIGQDLFKKKSIFPTNFDLQA